MSCDTKSADAIFEIEPFALLDASQSEALDNQLVCSIELASLIDAPIRATFQVEYVPGESLIDVVSFYHYINQFRHYRPCFETMVNKLFEDVQNAQPLDLVVSAEFELAPGYMFRLSRNSEQDAICS